MAALGLRGDIYMRSRWLALVLLAAAAPAAVADELLDEFVVVGRYPGPPLWRVGNGTNELWIFGMVNTIPKDMTWDSANVERVLGESESLLLPPGMSTKMPNPFKIFGLYRQARRLGRNAEGAALVDVVPPDLYQRYAVLRDRYIEKDRDLEEQRPAVVALRLYMEALDATGLTTGRGIQKEIERIARRAHVERVDTEIKITVDSLLDGVAELSPEAELECFATIISSVETDLAGQAARARAWATGDIAALRAFDYPDIRGDCLAFATSAEELDRMLEDSGAQWLQAAEQALGAQPRTFATLDIDNLVSPDGLLARLRERGYEVREPR